MRLVQIQADGSFSLVIHESTSIPPYAILSHTWSENNEDEVSYDDMCNEAGGEKSGYAKLKFCAERATKDGLKHFWVDTCCIDKSSSAELSEAITSMFRWYKNSAQCYVYLTDVTTKKRKSDRETPDVTWESTFRTSRWFTRGWTLQELLAPRLVLFFSRDRELLGTKFSLVQLIHEITHIPILTLQGAPLHDLSVEERMSWAKNRITKREEDSAYSLLGIFGVSMAAIYGEGKAVALRRLEKKINDVVQNQVSPPGDVKRQALMESLRFDQIDARYATIKNAHAKTCKWLLQNSEHTEWLDPARLPHHHGFLWIKGKPGTGKSTLMKFAFSQASKSKKRNVVIAFFFNARGEVLEKTIIGMYRSLLLQLLEKIPTLQCNPGSLSLVPSSIGADYQWTRHSLEDQLQQAVLSLGETPVMCFIDALDECEQWQVRSMISFFEHLGELAVSSGRSFRVCLSSRHYPEVNIRMGISLVLEGQEGHNQDINDYLESALRIGTSAAAQKIRNNLQWKSSGVFMWVVLVVDILNEEYDGGRMYALERRLKQIPADLHELFRDILTRDSNDKEELILCIQWVLFAKQPLQPEQLYFAILAGIEPDALTSQHYQEVTPDTIRRFLLRSSKGLTEITKSKKTKVQFIHESVRDFLLKENGLSKIWPEFRSNFQGQSHERLKQCCYNQISIDVATPLKLPDNLPKASLAESADLRKSATVTFPFLEYAVHNVLYHADTAEGGGISQADFVNSFPLLRWVKLDNLFEKHQVRRHTGGVSLLYILAELDMANLIRALGSASCCMDIEAERYGCPLFAAAARKSQQALDLCLMSIEVQENYSSLVSEVRGRHLQHQSEGRTSSLNFHYSKSKDLLLNALDLQNDKIIVHLIASGKFKTSLQSSPNSPNREVLRWASVQGFEMAARLLFAADPTLVTTRYRQDYTPLHFAAMYGHVKILELLLEYGVDVNLRRGNETALFIATSRGHRETVALLLDKGADIDAMSDSGNTALRIASANGHKEIVELLIGRGADIHAYGKFYGTGVQAASLNGHREILELLIEKGVDVNAQGGHHGSAIQAASNNGHKECLELLLDKGADVNAQGGIYGNALQTASYNGHKECLELLLDKGADVNAQGGRHGNALQAACENGHKEIVELLLEKGADIVVGNALEAASRSGSKEIVALLLERGADVVAGCAIEKASMYNHKEIVELLLDKGADIGNALEEAAFNGNKELVALLLERGADVGVGNALEKASRYGYKAIVELLLNKGANVGNALEEASRFGHEHVVELLLDKDADVANALQAASDRGQTDMVALLQKHSVAGSSK
jgi:ankyrin repeat protein